jgi:hypothetical protein
MPISESLNHLAVTPRLPDSSRQDVRIWAGGFEFHVPYTTVAVGPKPGGGSMVADIGRFSYGDSVRVIGDEGMDYRATIGGKP